MTTTASLASDISAALAGAQAVLSVPCAAQRGSVVTRMAQALRRAETRLTTLPAWMEPVSYTHLTLPTILRV